MIRLVVPVVVNLLMSWGWIVAAVYLYKFANHRDRLRKWQRTLGFGLVVLFVITPACFFHYAIPAWASSGAMVGGLPGLNCTSAGVSRLYSGGGGNVSVAVATQIVSFFSHCDSGEVELLGYESATAGTKCCVPAPRGRFACSGYFLVPNLIEHTQVLFENETRSSYASCCPTLFANIVPAGFSSLFVSATVGVLINLFLNAIPMFWHFTKARILEIALSRTTKQQQPQQTVDSVTVVELVAERPNDVRVSLNVVDEVESVSVGDALEHCPAESGIDRPVTQPTTTSSSVVLPHVSPNGADCAASVSSDDSVNSGSLTSQRDVQLAVEEAREAFDAAGFPLFTVTEGNRDRMVCKVSHSHELLAAGNGMAVEVFLLSDIIRGKSFPVAVVDLLKLINGKKPKFAFKERTPVYNCFMCKGIQCQSKAKRLAKRPPVLIGMCFSSDDAEVVCTTDDTSSIFTVDVKTCTARRSGPDHVSCLEKEWTNKMVSIDISENHLNVVVLTAVILIHWRRESRVSLFVRQRALAMPGGAVTSGVSACMFLPASLDCLLLKCGSQTVCCNLQSEEPLSSLKPHFISPFNFLHAPKCGTGCVAISPADKSLVAWGGDGGVCLWRLKSGVFFRDALVEDSIVMAFSPDGSILVEASGNECRVWRVDEHAGLRLFSKLTICHSNQYVFSSYISFSRDGAWMVFSQVMIRSNLWESLYYRTPGARLQLIDISAGMEAFKNNENLKFNELVADLFEISTLLLMKLVLGMTVGISLAIAIAHDVESETSLDAWARYEAFVLSFVNGPALSSLIDLTSIFVFSRTIRTSQSYPVVRFVEEPSTIEVWSTRFKLAASKFPYREYLSAVFIAICGALVFVVVTTHLLPGIVMFFPSLVVLALPFAVVVAITTLLVSSRFEYRQPNHITILRCAALLFAICASIGLSMLLTVLTKFPVNFAAIVYGNSGFPYWRGADDWTTLYNALFHVPAYLLQISSASCTTLRSSESAMTQLSQYLTLL